jgi:hypothetical protein
MIPGLHQYEKEGEEMDRSSGGTDREKGVVSRPSFIQSRYHGRALIKDFYASCGQTLSN